MQELISHVLSVFSPSTPSPVWAYALAFHGVPRFTGDLDLYVHRDAGNAAKIVAALAEFGFGLLGLTAADFERAEQVVQLGVPPVRIDGVSRDDAHRGRVEGMYGDVPVSFLGRRELVANNWAAGRRKDLADPEALGED